jgi:hypothetical protein
VSYAAINKLAVERVSVVRRQELFDNPGNEVVAYLEIGFHSPIIMSISLDEACQPYTVTALTLRRSFQSRMNVR